MPTHCRDVQAARGTPTLGRGYSPGLATSRGRRRSTTPQLAPQEAPLPPPTDSLFANSAVGDRSSDGSSDEERGAPRRSANMLQKFSVNDLREP